MVEATVPSTAETLIIGGGVIGTACAWWLEQSGHTVTVLERRDSVGSYTTPNSLGTIRTQFGTPALVEMAQESLAFYQDMSRTLNVSLDDLGWDQRGYLYLTDNPEHLPRLTTSVEEYEGLGVTSSSVLGADEMRQRFPFVGDAVGAIFHGDGAWVDPARIAHAWANATTSTNFVTGVTVEGLERAGSQWTVITDQGDVVAEQVIVCGGPLAPQLLEPFGLSMPMKITPRYRAFLPNEDPDLLAAPLVINIANGAYWRPAPAAAGAGVWLSTADVDEASTTPGESVTVPDGFLERCLEQIESVSPRLVEIARATPVEAITYAGGFQSYPADDVPFIGGVPGQQNLFANFGHWAGVMLSPASGHLLADVVNGQRATEDNPCRLTRFDELAGERTSTNKFGGWG